LQVLPDRPSVFLVDLLRRALRVSKGRLSRLRRDRCRDVARARGQRDERATDGDADVHSNIVMRIPQCGLRIADCGLIADLESAIRNPQFSEAVEAASPPDIR